jgi:hypothetical protein
MLGHLKSMIALAFFAIIVSATPVPATNQITARGWQDDCRGGGGQVVGKGQACQGGTWKGNSHKS